ncbi:hypothetical protein JHK84_037092 [Glycine max]|nr:hypothetical protein JHK84_037092 [Glycine max]
MSQSSQSLSRPLWHKEGQKSTQDPVVEKHHLATMKSLCSSTAAIIFAMTLILSIGVILSQSRTHPSSSPSVSKMSQSSKSLSDSLFHIEDQKSTEEPVVAASLKRIPPSTPNPIQN